MRRILLVTGLLAALAAGPALADQVLTIAHHTDALTMMGHTTPAQDATQEYWFGDQGVRYDLGDTSVIMRPDQKKLYFLNNVDKTYSALDLPIDFNKLVSPDMAPMMQQMMSMMKSSATVTPTDQTGKYAGFACKVYQVQISMAMTQMTLDECLTQDLPIDYTRYKSLAESQAEMLPNMQWMKDITEKLKGFPVHTDSTTTVMGKQVKGWQELKSVENRAPAPGFYEPPAGYKEVAYDPMKQMQRGHPQR